MTTVENVTQNLIPGFGAAIAGSPVQDQGELAATVNLDVLTDFSQQVNAAVPGAAAVNASSTTGTDKVELNKISATGLIATPTDAALLIDPTSETNSPVIVQSLRGAGVFFPSFEDDEQSAGAALTGLQAPDADVINTGLSVGFTAATQELSTLAKPLNTAATPAPTQSGGLSAQFSPLPTISELANANSLTQARGAGHILPVAELDNVHTAAQLNAAAGSQAQDATSSAADALQRPAASTGPVIDPALAATNTSTTGEANSGLNSFASEALKQAEALPFNRSASDAPSSLGQPSGQIPLNGGEKTIDENIDADGQVLNVIKKATENSFIAGQRQQNIEQQQNQTSQTQAQTQGTSAAATQAAASTATATAAHNNDGGIAKPLPATEKRDALNTAIPDNSSVSPRTNIDQITPAQRAAVNWSAPWSGTWTPERAAGWPEGFGADVIASGLTGMKGEGSAVMGMGLMGGKPNPALGGHVAKQLNVNVTRAVKAGDSEFAMRMDPPELGKVMVKLKFGADGMVRASVFVERPETLELLQRETRGLEKAIEAGGSKAAEDGISFSLDSGNGESAGKAFAEAVQQDRLKDALSENGTDTGGDRASAHAPDDLTETIDLEEILAHVTPETGLDVRV